MNMVIAILFVAALGVCSATLERRAPFSCGFPGYLTQDNGIIDSHTGYASGVVYGNSMNCNWKIKAPPGMYIEIKAKSFSLESNNQCTYDYLEIFDGDNIRAHKIGKFCGTTIGNYTSSQNIMTLHFRTDGSTVKPGFRLQYQFTNVSAPPICGHAGYLTTDHGIIDSHLGYASGQPYDKNLDCKWKVKAPAGMKILVTAKTFEVESRSQCTHDYLELLDGDGLSAPSLDKFCGTAMTPTMSTQNILTLHFVTDNYYLRSKGFRLHYNFTTHYERFCPTGEFKCRNNNCCESRWKCDGDDDCGDDSDETGCPRATCAGDKFKCDNGGCLTWDWLCDGNDDCGDASDENSTNCMAKPTNSPVCGQLNTTGVNGTISSPNFPGHYPSNEHCIWKVQGPPGTLRISISFDTNKYGMESASRCKFDYVKVYSGRHSTIHGPYCGTTAPTKFVMQGDHAFIKFQSDGSNEAIGFKIYWKALST